LIFLIFSYGFKKIKIETIIIIIATVLLKVVSDKSIANSAPIKEPTIAGTLKTKLNFQFSNPFLKNSMRAVIFCIIIAILLVPLAKFGGRPKKISSGNDISDPPAEIILIKPTITPTRNNKKYILNNNFNRPFYTGLLNNQK